MSNGVDRGASITIPDWFRSERGRSNSSETTPWRSFESSRHLNRDVKRVDLTSPRFIRGGPLVPKVRKVGGTMSNKKIMAPHRATPFGFIRFRAVWVDRFHNEMDQ